MVTIDTLHLFPETLAFVAATEKRLNFSARVFLPTGVSTRAEFEVPRAALQRELHYSRAVSVFLFYLLF